MSLRQFFIIALKNLVWVWACLWLVIACLHIILVILWLVLMTSQHALLIKICMYIFYKFIQCFLIGVFFLLVYILTFYAIIIFVYNWDYVKTKLLLVKKQWPELIFFLILFIYKLVNADEDCKSYLSLLSSFSDLQSASYLEFLEFLSKENLEVLLIRYILIFSLCGLLILGAIAIINLINSRFAPDSLSFKWTVLIFIIYQELILLKLSFMFIMYCTKPPMDFWGF